MSTKVGTFFLDLAIDASSGNLSVNQLISSLGKLDVASVGTVGVIGRVTDKLWDMAKAATGIAVEMSILGQTTGVDTKLAQQWEKAAVKMNVQAGSIIRSIRGVSEMMGAIEAGTGTIPMEFGRLGITTPIKGFDPKGDPIYKTFMDLMKEMSESMGPASRLSPRAQQTLLGGAFTKSDPIDIFRILENMRAGKWEPEKISVLEEGQIDKLTGVREKQIEIVQRLTGIFLNLITEGEWLEEALGKLSDIIDDIDKFIRSPKGKEALAAGGEVFTGVIGNVATKPFDIFRDLMKELLRPRDVGPAGGPSQQNVRVRVGGEVTVKNEKGEIIGQVEAKLQEELNGVPTDSNGGLGQ